MSTSIRITVTVPESILRSDFMRDQIMQKMREKTGPDLRKEFMKTVNGWEGKPEFSQKFTNSVSAVSTEVFPSGTNRSTYELVNAGSPPHPIRAKNGRGLLRFQSGYRAATRPRVIGSRGKSRFGDAVSVPIVRRHPGFVAREFDMVIAEEYQSTFEDDMQDAINAGAQRR
jgi:hypothetical protein